MIPVLLGASWALVVAGTAGMGRRPPPRRVRVLVRRPPPNGGGSCAIAGHRRPLPSRAAAGCGSLLLRAAGRPDDPVLATRLGAAALAAVPAALVAPAAAPVVALAAWVLPKLRARREARRRSAALAGELPEVVDLLALAVGAGMTVPLAVAAVARRAAGPLAAELARVCDEVTLGRRLADALDDVPSRAGEMTRPLTSALAASERYGAPLQAGLERLADEVRRERRRRAEDAVRRVPVKLLFPLVTCTLPAFALLTVAPLIASAVRSLRL